MKGMQKRRLEVATATTGAGGIIDTIMEQSQTDAANFHGMRFCFSLEPENADANANGFWAVWCLPAEQIQTADLPNTVGEFNDETQHAAYLWGIGCYTASNQAPYHMEFAPSTTRNCALGARLVLRVFNTGISAGLARVNTIITGFTSS